MWEWIDQKVEEAQEADSKGDMRTVYQIHRQLGIRDKMGRRDGTKESVGDPEKERDVWKEHFKRIQQDHEMVSEEVWENIKQNSQTATWMSVPPTDAELDRCIQYMKNNKATGEDEYAAEYLKNGSDKYKKQIYRIAREMWSKACQAQQGQEAKEWPESWKRGIVIPLWKKKGDKKDKNTWRGVTLLSVGSKLIARVVAERTQAWSSPWLYEAQCGFRKGRGVDDVLQVSRRLLEEAVTNGKRDEIVLLRLFDIEKAYPRVSKDALWRLMEVKGAPKEFIQVCKGLHEHTEYAVRIHDGLSTGYRPDKGLREGCPSSPPLFNVFHDAVMEDFRIRRNQAAQAKGWTPGLKWEVKVDGKYCMDTTRNNISRTGQ